MGMRKRKKIARENGAKAAGTKTPEGIQKSAMNAVRHGLTGKTLVLCNESQAQFDALTQRYIQKFQPQDEVDMELIDDLVAARWRMQRVRLMQAAALDLEMDRQADEIEASFVNIDEPTRATLAFTKLANTEKSLELFHRYETTYTRQYNRTLKLLESKLQTNLRNDPKIPLPPSSLSPTPDTSPTPESSPSPLPTTPTKSPLPTTCSPLPTTNSSIADLREAGFQPAGRFPIGLPTKDAPPWPTPSLIPLAPCEPRVSTGGPSPFTPASPAQSPHQPEMPTPELSEKG